ncbi:poly(A)-specific ribonuclease [Coelomomyces lativittatus]|nr:poly(A)-specific ribonuclease [Coelomomyces lativittatus]
MVRGNGPEQGTVCLDDFVMPKAPVIDYLTPYSGITPEDLNPSTSRQRLVTLKTVYRKLRYMVDHGVHFIGHDLVQDFRILHLTVPTSQLLDTVHLYSQPTWHRKLSLKFLAWAVLGLHVQVTTHDSIEDATIALHLYQKYVSMDSSQQWQALIQNVYRLGALHGYRPPPPPSEETKRVSTLAS